MKCNYNIEDIINYIENDISGEKKLEIRCHLKECSKCNKDYSVTKIIVLLNLWTALCTKN
jgi:hypothetical protein